jgi:hypothetical protein
MNKKELWNLDYTITEFVLPRLIAFRKMKKMARPFGFKSVNEWNKALDKMIVAFQLVKEETSGLDMLTNEQVKRINEGLGLFAKHFRSLWE